MWDMCPNFVHPNILNVVIKKIDILIEFKMNFSPYDTCRDFSICLSYFVFFYSI